MSLSSYRTRSMKGGAMSYTGSLYRERAFSRPCDLINQYALVHLVKYLHRCVIHDIVGCPFTKEDSLLASGIDIDPSTQPAQPVASHLNLY